MAESFAEYVTSILLLNTELTAETDIAKASLSANRIIGMRGTDQVEGKLISLDVGNIGEEDMGVKVQFQNVWFRYPTRDVPILNGLNLTVSKLRSQQRNMLTNGLCTRSRKGNLQPLSAHQVHQSLSQDHNQELISTRIRKNYGYLIA